MTSSWMKARTMDTRLLCTLIKNSSVTVWRRPEVLGIFLCKLRKMDDNCQSSHMEMFANLDCRDLSCLAGSANLIAVDWHHGVAFESTTQTVSWHWTSYRAYTARWGVFFASRKACFVLKEYGQLRWTSKFSRTSLIVRWPRLSIHATPGRSRARHARREKLLLILSSMQFS